MASISWTAFSPSNSNSGSPLCTISPGCFSQRTKVPSSIDQPNLGTVIEIALAQVPLFIDEFSAHRLDMFGCWHHDPFQRRTIGCGTESAVQAANRRVLIVETRVANGGS